MGPRHHALARKFLGPAPGSRRRGGRAPAITARDPGTMWGSGAPMPGRGRDPGGRRPPRRGTKGTAGPGPGVRRGRRGGNFVGRWGEGARPGGPFATTPGTIARPSAGRPAATPPPRRARVRPRTWWLSFLPPAAAAGPPGPLVMFTYRERVRGLRSVHILLASHTDARLRHSQPTNSLIGGRGRSLRSPPAPGRGGRAAASSRSCRCPGSSHRAQLAHPAPFRAEAGGGGGEERAVRSLLASPFLSARGTPPPRAPVSTRTTYALLRRAPSGARSLRPMGCPPGRRDKGSALPPPVWCRLVMAETVLICLGQGRSFPKAVTEASPSLQGSVRSSSGLSSPESLL